MLSDIITRGVQIFPNQVALIFREQSITYTELGAAVDRLANGLGEIGIQRGERIALLLPNCPAFVYGYFAAVSFGAIVVPVNPLLKPAELEYIWKDADVRLVITIPQLLPAVQAARQNLPDLKTVVCTDSRENLPDPALADSVAGFIGLGKLIAMGAKGMRDGLSPVLQEERDENECAVIIYTSGTTGRPKGAMLSHRNLTRNVEQVLDRLKFMPADRFLTVLPLFHAFAATVCMNVCMTGGCASLLLETFAPARALELIQTHAITIFPAVPAIYNAMLMASQNATYNLGSLRMFVSGGAPLPAATLEALEARFSVPVLEGDGPTECSPVTSVNPMEGPRKIGSVGPALPGVEIAIFDDSDTPLPAEAIGEIVVRGDNVMLGYLNQPEATAEAMKSGWYHTGDVGKMDADGYVYILDRKKDMIITAGLNVYPREVEEVLLSHPAVADAAVIGLPDTMRGEEVAAVIVRRPNSPVTERELTAHCRALLANYKVPRRVLFRDTLPRGATGKVVKRLLKKELEME